MDKWRGWAQSYPRGSFPAVVANLPVVPCKQGAEELGRDGSGTPHGLCDTCFSNRRRTARREASSSTPSASPYSPLLPVGAPASVPTPLPNGGTSCGSKPPHTPTLRPPPPPVSRTLAAMAPPASTACVGTLRRVNLLVGGALAATVGACELASQPPDLPARRPPSTPVEQAAGTPSLSSPRPAAATCKMLLEALQAGRFDNAEDKEIFGRIASAVLLRGSPDVLRLTRSNGAAAIYTRRVSPCKASVKKSQANKRRAAARKELLVTCPSNTSVPVAAADPGMRTGGPSRVPSGSLSGVPSAEE